HVCIRERRFRAGVQLLCSKRPVGTVPKLIIDPDLSSTLFIVRDRDDVLPFPATRIAAPAVRQERFIVGPDRKYNRQFPPLLQFSEFRFEFLRGVHFGPVLIVAVLLWDYKHLLLELPGNLLADERNRLERNSRGLNRFPCLLLLVPALELLVRFAGNIDETLTRIARFRAPRSLLVANLIAGHLRLIYVDSCYLKDLTGMAPLAFQGWIVLCLLVRFETLRAGINDPSSGCLV